jgi:hypothetical protein
MNCPLCQQPLDHYLIDGENSYICHNGSEYAWIEQADGSQIEGLTCGDLYVIENHYGKVQPYCLISLAQDNRLILRLTYALPMGTSLPQLLAILQQYNKLDDVLKV